MPAGSGLALLADVADRECRDGFSQLVIRRKHPVIPVPVLPRRRDEIGEPVQELKRRELDDAARPRPRGLAAAAGPDPGGRFVSGQHIADAGDPAVWAADHGEPGAGSYLGFRARTSNLSNDWTYGYFQVTWNSTSQNFQIFSGAYESTVNTPITVPVPEPTGVALAGIGALALGAGAIRRSRKARKAAAEAALAEAV